MKKKALIFIVGLILFSCEKENHISKENIGIPLIESIMTNGNAFIIYTYTDANLLSEEKSKFHYTRHHYNSKNQLTASDFYWDISLASSSWSVVETALKRKEWVSPENTKKSLTKSYEYNNIDQSIKVMFNRSSVNDNEYIEYKIDNGRISQSASFWQSEMSFLIDYEYDETGNLIRESKYFVPPEDKSPELWTSTEYEFDNMNNPFKAFSRLMVPGKYTNTNNIKKETYTIHFEIDPWIDKFQVTEYSYRYNELGYPVTVNNNTEYIYN